MSRAEKLAHLINRIAIVEDDIASGHLLERLLTPTQPTILAFVNTHAVNLCWRSDAAYDAFRSADVILRDGKGMEILLTRSGRPAGRNLNGTDFIPQILNKAIGQDLAIIGTKDPWLSTACQRLEAQGYNIVAACDGFQNDQTYIDAIQKTRPHIILLAQGMPRQEHVARALKAALPDHPMVIICGGAIVDFLAGRVRRAPNWMRRAGLEWLYRLSLEPKRLFSRYVVGNVAFLMRVPKIASALRGPET